MIHVLALLLCLFTPQLLPEAGWSQDRREIVIRDIAPGELPREARETLRLIKRGGPFPYARDGSIFNNFERHLPIRKRGYYREYTVPTPGRRDRGARRIVAGENGEYYYTEDHYRTFRRVRIENELQEQPLP